MKAPVMPRDSWEGPSPMRLASDDRLARRAVRGDQRAFEAIYRRYHQELYRFCLAMVGNPQDAQDALQNTMVKVLRALPGEERQINLKPWLYRIARNESVEALRRRRDGVELQPDETQASVEIAQTAEDRERLRVLFTDLEQLPDRQRSALVMRELAGLDFAQIGEAFGSSAAVARQTLYEARLSLRQMEEGREMTCEAVTRALSDADGRVTRRRDVHAHLRSCASCRAFQEGVAKRQSEFAALAPLPVAISAGLLQGLLGGHAGTASAATAATGAAGAGAGGAGGVGGAIGVGAGKAVATSAIVKAAATVAVVAVAGVSVADRSGVVDVGLPGGQSSTQQATDSAVPHQGDGNQASDDASGGAPAALKTSRGQGQANAPNAPRAAENGRAASHRSARAKHGRPAPGPRSGKRSNGSSSRGRSQEARDRSRPPAATGGNRGAGRNLSRESSAAGGKPAAKSPSPPPTQSARPEPAAPPASAPETTPRIGGGTSHGPAAESPESSEP